MKNKYINKHPLITESGDINLVVDPTNMNEKEFNIFKKDIEDVHKSCDNLINLTNELVRIKDGKDF